MTDWFEMLKGANQEEILRAVRQEDANLMAAWVWAVEHRHLDMIHKAMFGLTLISMMHNLRFEIASTYDRVIQMAREVEDQTLLAFMLATNRIVLALHSRRRVLCERECFNLLPLLLPSAEKAYTQVLLASGLSEIAGEDILKLCQESGTYFQSVNDDWGSAIADLVSADVRAILLRDFEQAEQAYRRSLEQFTILDNAWGRALCLNGLAISAESKGDYTQAVKWQAESLVMMERLGDRVRIIEASLMLANYLIHIGDQASARQLLEKNLALVKRIGYNPFIENNLDLLRQTLEET